jgi:hypothetical protein
VTSPTSPLRLSVVVASRQEDGGPRACLDALASQRDGDTEVVVASAGAAALPEFPWTVWLEGPVEATVPGLWGLGLDRAQGDVVAFTTAQFLPSPDWLATIREAHSRLGAAGIGGPIEPPAARTFGWAIFFLRYSAYLAYRRETRVPDLAGDNTSYKRRALLDAGAIGGEFWEQEAHRKLFARGQELVFVPQMKVQQRGAPPFGVFLRQRVRHGRRFGTDRASRRGRIWRMAAFVASPLVPGVLLAKVAVRVLRARRYAGPFVRSLPALAACAGAWGLGEGRGYLDSLREGHGGG